MARTPKSTKWNELPRNPQTAPLGTPSSFEERDDSHQMAPAQASARSAGIAWKRGASAPLDEADTGPPSVTRTPVDAVHRLLDQEEAAPRLGVVARQSGVGGGGARREFAAVAHLDLETVLVESDDQVDRLAAPLRVGVDAGVHQHLVEAEDDLLARRGREAVRLEQGTELRADQADRLALRDDAELDFEFGAFRGGGHEETLDPPSQGDKEGGSNGGGRAQLPRARS